jgi:hypothetical protein
MFELFNLAIFNLAICGSDIIGHDFIGVAAIFIQALQISMLFLVFPIGGFSDWWRRYARDGKCALRSGVLYDSDSECGDGRGSRVVPRVAVERMFSQLKLIIEACGQNSLADLLELRLFKKLDRKTLNEFLNKHRNVN